MRRVPLMYAAMDLGPPKRRLLADFLTCSSGGDPASAVDVFGLNAYSWCAKVPAGADLTTPEGLSGTG